MGPRRVGASLTLEAQNVSVELRFGWDRAVVAHLWRRRRASSNYDLLWALHPDS